MARNAPVETNTNGRPKYLVLCGTALFLACILGMSMAITNKDRTLRGCATVVALVGCGYLTLVAFVASVYTMRYVNAGFLAVSSALVLIIVGLSLGSEKMWLIATEVVLFLYLAFMALLLAHKPTSDLALRLHPFFSQPELEDFVITGPRLSGRTSTTSTDASRSSSKRGTRRIKHRQVSIFENWPAPIPFTAQALYTYRTTVESELSFSRGDQLTILDCRGNWWQARHPKTNAVGFVPSNYIQVLQKARVLRSFEAKDEDEASVGEGETVEVMEVHEFMCLIRNLDGKIGSVPTENLEVNRVRLEDL